MTETRVAIYIRVSTNEQATEGYSISEQKDRCVKYCEAMRYTVAKIYTDPGYSGSNIDRPAMQQLISDVKTNLFDTVLVYKLDRLSRSQKDTLYLIEDVFLKNNVSFISMSENFDTSSPFGRAMIGILSVFAQLEREQIKERMTMGRIGAAKLGRWRGGSGVPLGYKYTAGDGGVLKIDEYEASQVKELFSLWNEGISSSAICTRFRNKGYTNKYGKWNNAGVIPDIISNPIYIGKQRYDGNIFPGLQEGIIPYDVFQAAQLELRRRRENMTENQRTAWRGKKLLSGILYCGECGARYFVTSSMRKDKETEERIAYYYYKCYTRDGNRQMKKADKCSNKTWRMDHLDNLILSEIRSLSYDSDRISEKKDKNRLGDQNVILDRIQNIDKQIKSLLDLYQFDSIPIDEVGKRISKLRAERSALQETIKRDLEKDDGKLSIKEAKEILKSAPQIIDFGSEDEKKRLISKLIKKIIVNQGDIDIHWSFT